METPPLLDRLLGQFDRALRACAPGAARARRDSPAARVAEDGPLDAPRRRRAVGLMRVNHTGEVCAQALYAGQAATARLAATRRSMEQAAEEETDHLAWCESRLDELGGRPSLLNPLWYAMSWGLGAAAGLAGDRWSLGFVAETERRVCRHLEDHLERLPGDDRKSRAILEQMISDERRHAETAEQAGGAPLPPAVKGAMAAMAELMKRSAYHV